MSILSGIPCVIYTKDARTRELAEFYEIPHYTKEPDSTLWEEFLKADYTGFNRTYKKQYEKFKQFLVSHNIVDDINTNNNFWNKDEPTANKAIEAILMRMNGFVETDNHYMSQCAKKYSGKKFVIFGAGNLGEEAAKLLGEENVKCFVDNDAAKQKSGYLGFEVFSLDKVSIEKNKDLLIIAVSERYIDDIIAQLDHKEISNYYTIKEVKSDLALGRNEVTDFGL